MIAVDSPGDVQRVVVGVEGSPESFDALCPQDDARVLLSRCAEKAQCPALIMHGDS